MEIRNRNRLLGKFANRQRGAIALTAGIVFIPLFLFLVLVVDTGRLFIQKRATQTDADLAALETAVLYCRDQSMDADARRAAAVNTLSQSRNDFKGLDGDIAVALGKVSKVSDGAGGTIKQFTEDPDGSAIQVTLNYTVPASIFSQIAPSGASTVTFTSVAVSQACQPEARLTLRSNFLTVDTAQSALLNTALGGLLGTTLNLGVGSWQALLDTDINLLNFFDAAIAQVGLSAGNYEGLLSSEISIADTLDIAAEVLNNSGGDALAVNALEDIALAVPGDALDINLGDILTLQPNSPEAALDVGLQAFQLVQGAIQLANSQSGVAADIPVSVLGLTNATIKIQVLQPPQLSAIGNPEYAKADPYGEDAIEVRSSQVRVFVSLDLPIVGGVLSTLQGLLDVPLISGITDTVNDLLSLNIGAVLADILCLVGCQQTEDIADIDVLSSPRLDIALDAGSGEARVSDYSCDDSTGDKTLTVPTQTSAVSVLAGQLGTDATDAENNAFNDVNPTVEPVAILDIGSIRVRKTCVLLICGYEYQKQDGTWSNNPADAHRTAFSGGGIGLKVDTDLLAGNQTLSYANDPSDQNLPEIDSVLSNDAYQSINSSSLVNSTEDSLLGVELEFYNPTDGSGLGNVVGLVGVVADPLSSAVTGIVNTALSPILSAVIDELLNALGIELAETEVGAALTCQTGKVTLEI